MSHIILNKWRKLVKELKVQRSSIDRSTIIKLLLKWSLEVKKIKDKRVQKLYSTYLEYFEKCSITENDIIPWYSLNEIIDIDLINQSPLTYDRAIIKVRDVLWELLIFKSDKSCPCCGDDNLRVMTNAVNSRLFFTCDLCGCILNEFGNEMSINEKLFPAPIEMIKLHGIAPNPI